MRFLHFIKNLFCCRCLKTKGSIVLGFGVNEISIDLKAKPKKIVLDVETPCDGTPVCGGDVNKVCIIIDNHGFTIKADIKTNSCCIDWECDL